MKSCNLFILSCFALLCSFSGFAQKTVSGRVTGGTTNDALPGASIRVSGTSIGTTADSNGRFILTLLPANRAPVLHVSYTGYQDRMVPVDGRSVIDINLEPGSNPLEDVVVVGYGSNKEANLTGSVSVVSSKSISGKPVGQTSMALQGVAPGLTITQTSGQPGMDAGAIRIRGIGTLGTAGQSPLILVDGVEMNIDNVDPGDIESISVLKDASSAAIYGSRAANGVIIITTKRAKSGRISVSYNGYAGKQYATTLPKLVDGLDHMLMLNEAKSNMGQAPNFSDEYIEAYRQNSPSDLYPNTNWQDLTLTNNGLIQNHSVDVSGGNNFIKLRASVNHLEQNGLIPNTGYKRTSLRINTDIRASEKLSFRADIRGNDDDVYEPGVSADHIFYLMNGRLPANQEGLLSNGNYGQGWLGENSIAAANASGNHDVRTYSAYVNLQADWKPLKGLNLNLMYAPEFSNGYNKLFLRTYKTYYGNGDLAYLYPSTTNSVTQKSIRDVTKNLHALLTYTTGFGQHHIKLLAGYEQIESSDESFSAERESLILQDYPVLNSGSLINQQATGAGALEYGLVSYFGRVNYDFKEKYLLEANFRYDGSSRFAQGKKFGLFPSFSAGWRISREDFLKDSRIIDNLKIRASWGRLGNQNIGYYPFASSVDLNRSYVFNEAAVSGAAITQLGNPDISWESTTMFNVGIDARFWKKFSLTAEYYIRNTSNILLTLPIPYSVGMDAPYQNAGKVRNTGWDLSIGYEDHAGDFRYGVDLVLSDVRNTIVDLKGTGPYIDGVNIRAEGYPIDAIYGYKSEGLFQTADEVQKHATQFGGLVSPGDIKYTDQNGDGVINADDRVVLGSIIPRYTYSLNLHASYKSFDLTCFLQGVGKVDSYLSGEGVWAFYVGSTAYEWQKNHWSPDNPNAPYPRLTFGDQNNIQNSDYWMINGAYLRVKNLQLGYTLPRVLLSHTFIQNLRIWAGGQNLFTIDHFLKGFDAETPVGGISHYPIIKVYSFGIQANF
jgi:TonB-linked SusC/RagA family outer membrane protein